MAYADVLLGHFHRPRNQHVMTCPDVVAVAGTPHSGPFLVLYLRLEGPKVVDASFQTHGCAPSIAAGSLLCTQLPGARLPEAAARWTEVAIHEALGGLPDHKRHCSALAAAALTRAAALAAGPRPDAPVPVGARHAAPVPVGARHAAPDSHRESPPNSRLSPRR